MALLPETKKALMDALRVKQPQSIAAPLSPYEDIQMQEGLLSTDPVISKLQKVGRGVKSLLEPETPVDYLMSGLGPAKAVQAINKGKKIYHGTNAKYKDFDLDKSADGTIWFSDNKDMVKKGYDGASGNKYVMERTIDEKALKLADWDMADKYMLPQLIDMGYDGIKYSEPKAKDTVYQIFNPQKLKITADSDVISDYMMAHRPYAGPRAHNLLEKVDGDSFSPNDIYQNARFYIGSTPRQKEYKETMEFMDLIKKNKGNPNAEVTIYRGSPNKELNTGDWITPSKEYAKMEAGGKGGQVQAHKVKLKDIRWDGNSLEEWGYFPSK